MATTLKLLTGASAGHTGQRLGNLVATGVSGRQLLQIRRFLVQHAQDAPCAFGEVRESAVEVDVVARLQPGPPAFGTTRSYRSAIPT